MQRWHIPRWIAILIALAASASTILALYLLAQRGELAPISLGPSPTTVHVSKLPPSATAEPGVVPPETPGAASTLPARAPTAGLSPTPILPERPTTAPATPAAARSPAPTLAEETPTLVPVTPTAGATPTAAVSKKAPATPRPSSTPAPTPVPTARPTPPQPAAYFVDSVHGSDTNTGLAPDAAWRTLAAVNARRFKPGEVINLARGSTWTGPGSSATLIINGAGQPDKPIIVKPYGSGAPPVLRNPSNADSDDVAVRSPWVIVQELNLQNAHRAGVLLPAGADHVAVQFNEMSAVGTGVYAESQFNWIAHNYVHDTTMIENTGQPDTNYGADGVIVHAANNEIAYNRFINCRGPSLNYGTDGGAVDFFGNVDNTYIHHNYAFNVNGFEEVAGGSAHNIVIAYNVIVNSGPVVGLHAQGRFASDIEGLQFINNTVIDMVGAYSLYYIEGSLKNADALVVRNNIFYIKDYTMLLQNPQPFTHDHNLYYFAGSPPEVNYQFADSEKAQDPMFVDLAKGDYRLRAGSPAIGAGEAMNNAARDFADVALPAGASRDLGAYQYQEGQS